MKFLKACFFLSITFLSTSWVSLHRVHQNLSKMSLEEKVGQLFTVPFCPARGEDHFQDLQTAIQKYHIGGVILQRDGTTSADPISQVRGINRLQSNTKWPLLTFMDAEWGLGMRMENTMSFPKNLTLGAVDSRELFEKLGKQIAIHCKLVGVCVNLAPVVDVNTNPLNPIIHMRSFGQVPQEVGKKASLVMKSMQHEGILCCLKHFPGHGDTSIDSHMDLPLISHDHLRIYHTELQPFRYNFFYGASCVMSAHLMVKAFDEKKPFSLSDKTPKILREYLGFTGLFISDALNMKALSTYYSVEEIALGAYQAGHDILLYGDHIAPNIDKIIQTDLPKAYHTLLHAFQTGKLDQKELNNRVSRILLAKEKANLFDEKKLLEETNLIEKLHSQEAKDLKRKLFQDAITVVRNDFNVLPLRANKTVAYVTMGEVKEDVFKKTLQKDLLLDELQEFSELAKNYSTVLVWVYGAHYGKNYPPLSEKQLRWLKELSQSSHVVIMLFGSPYGLKQFQDNPSVVVAYEQDVDAQIAAAEIILGKIKPKGKLPVSCGKYSLHTGLTW